MRGRLLGILLLVLAVLITAAPPGPAEAAITTPFAARFDVNANGAIMLRGNASLTCPIGVGTCANARNGIGSTATEELNDNGYAMVYTDTDGDPATFNDSTATVAMPAGSSVLFAGLYWGADPRAGTSGAAAPTPADKGKVLFRTPSAATWTPVVSTSLFMISATGAYQGFADVTALVAGAGDGVYGVANIQSGRGVDRYAGWTLVIAYRNAAEDYRSLRVYDGFGSISGTESVQIPVTGFETPHSGPVHTEVGAVSYEGDLGKFGDELRLDGQLLSDGANPADNVFNSTVSERGSPVGGRNPPYTNLFGVDIDQIAADGVLGNAVTSATLSMKTNGETYYPGVITIAIDLYAPKIVTTSTATDVDGDSLLPGDEIEYRIEVRNEGNDWADGVVISDAFPAWTTYVPGSLTVEGVPAADPADADAAEVTGGAAVFRLGSIPYLGATWVTFRVRVDVGVPAGHAISNMVNAGYTGRTTSVSVTSSGGAVASTVLQPDADLAAALTVTPDTVQRPATPQPVAYTAIVTNGGPDLEPDARVTITLPAGVTAGTLPFGCMAVGAVVTCPLGPLLAGHQASVTVPAEAGSTAAASAVATLTVAGDGRDTGPGDDTATATLRVNSRPTAPAANAVTSHNDPVTIDVAALVSDPDDTVLTVTLASVPGHGTAVAGADGKITYLPSVGWTGTDTFSYQVDDGSGGVRTATITVTTANVPPVAGDDETGTPSGQAVAIAVLDNDTDVNVPDPLSVAVHIPPDPAEGTVGQAGNVLTFTPAGGFTGRAHFTYTVMDSHGDQDIGDVWVDVANTAPTAADDLASTDHHTDVLIDVIDNDYDPDGDPLGIDSVGTPADGTAIDDNDLVRYQPPAGFRGDVTFPYAISDGHTTVTATVTVTVRNASPVATDHTATIGTGQYADVDVLTGATDVNTGDPLRIAGTTIPAHGTAVVQAGGIIRYTPDQTFWGTDDFDFTIDDGNGGTDTRRITVTVTNGLPVARADAITVPAGSAKVIDVFANDTDDPNGETVTVTVTVPPAHGTAVPGPGRMITFTPTAGYLGPDTFDYTLSDGNGTTTTTVTIGVVNIAPQARADTAVTDTDTPVTVDLLGNDDDANGDPVTVAAVTGGGFGTIRRGPGGTVTYRPRAGFQGVDTVGYTIEDPARASSSAVLTVIVRNAPPVAVDDDFAAEESAPTILDVLANDHDPNTGQPLTVTEVRTTGGGTAVIDTGGTVTYVSAPGAWTDSLTYTISDDMGRTDSAAVTVHIYRLPRPTPSATASASPPVPPSPTSPSPGAPPSGSPSPVPGSPSPGSPSPGSPSPGSPSPGSPSPGSPSPAPPSSGPNRPPLVTGDLTAVTSGEEVTLWPAGNDSDPDGDDITLVGVGRPAHGTARTGPGPGIAAAGESIGAVTYIPDDGFTGLDRFTYTITDGRGGTATGMITVRVTAARPDMPVTGPDSASVARAGALVVLTGAFLRWLTAARPGRHRKR
ncbi:Ig-like domain-containing protein [Actinoplanes subglobosus]|uniref:Ig-like domain-containing protein n=1 Tax=Actinoplanes subglobosus TaxID=1547892 RepID=A0ABV8IWE4_9ACTN